MRTVCGTMQRCGAAFALSLAVALVGCASIIGADWSGTLAVPAESGSAADADHDEGEGTIGPADDGGAALSGRDGSTMEGATDEGAPIASGDAGALLVSGGVGTVGVLPSIDVVVTISRDFDVDAREVTVARFEAWINAGMPAPSCDGGACSLDPGGPHESAITWNAAWNKDVLALDYKSTACRALGGSAVQATTYLGGEPEAPITCANWAQAVAFCWWDGQRRLLTRTEWQYAASGRGQGRTYPWGDVPEPSDCTRAIWRAGASAPDFNGCAFPRVTGSAPLGASRDGLLDLAGSVSELVWDVYTDGYPNPPPPDFAGPAPTLIDEDRTALGGGWDAPVDELSTKVITRVRYPAAYSDVGFRCAKTRS